GQAAREKLGDIERRGECLAFQRIAFHQPHGDRPEDQPEDDGAGKADQGKPVHQSDSRGLGRPSQILETDAETPVFRPDIAPRWNRGCASREYMPQLASDETPNRARWGLDAACYRAGRIQITTRYRPRPMAPTGEIKIATKSPRTCS